ncbi:uncharacterized protein LOC126824958 [Patella vulgata]|uniref:uncharacterized protein LOC126824958 n=1 Tax=Patella vulgata TaxID=6465 RepID=UPI0024A82830|nr:uncharacterized protein LOC126824958 [Patella vulgata]
MTAIIKEYIKLPGEFENYLAFALYNVFTPQECNELIEKTEEMGYKPALINGWESTEQSNRIWNRVKDYVCSEIENDRVTGLNKQLKFLRYDPGEYFKPHFDGCYTGENGEKSYFSLQLYLNEGFKGGSTTFISKISGDRVEFVPKTGAVLIFQQDILHEGSLLEEGRKYSCRTDIMCRIKHETEVMLGKENLKKITREKEKPRPEVFHPQHNRSRGLYLAYKPSMFTYTYNENIPEFQKEKPDIVYS